MKRLFLCSMLSIVLSTAAPAQDVPPESPEAAVVATAPVKGPSIFVEETEYNFGVVDTDTTVEHTFVIKNIGDETLEIANARPACGCTVANITEKSVPPGGESLLTARLSLRGRKGHQSKSITVNSNDPEKPQYRLVLVGDVDQAIQVNPDRLIYGQMAPGQEVSLSVALTGVADKDFQILKIETNSDDLIATVENPAVGKNHIIKATLTAPADVGPVNGIVRITTDHPERPSIDIPVAANVVGELVFAPSELVVPGDAGDKPLTRYIVVRKGTVDNFEIKEVVTPSDDITTTIYPFGDQGYRVQIENIVVSDELNGKEIHILTSAANMSEITIPFAVR